MKADGILGRGRITTTLLILAAGAACVWLGIWQLDRLAQRRVFNERVEGMLSLPALELPSREDLTGQEYRLARARGQYDFEHQVALRNQVFEGQYGYHLLTPFRLGDGAGENWTVPAAILVDRGWIPATDNAGPQDWRRYDQAGMVEIKGVIRRGQDAPAFGGSLPPTPAAGKDGSHFWPYVDIARIGLQIPYVVLPVYLQGEGLRNSAVPPVAIPWQPDLSEGPHLAYAIQWFSFAAILLLGYPVYVTKKERRAA